MITFFTVKLKKKKINKNDNICHCKTEKNNKHGNIFYCKTVKKSTKMIHLENCKIMEKQKI